MAARPFYRRPPVLGWSAALALFILFWQFGKPYAPWAFRYPRGWTLPLKNHISDFMAWLVDEAGFGLFSFTDLTRGIAWVIEQPYRLVTSALATGFLQGQGSDAVMILPPLSWIAVIVIMAALGRYARDWRLALLTGGCFTYLAVFGQWNSAMITLSSILIAVPIGIAGGLVIGIAGYRWRWLERLITPLLDLMQTVPVFAYLVPILFLFGFGPVSALVATVIYAMPPMVRVTVLALQSVPGEVADAGRMMGCTRRRSSRR